MAGMHNLQADVETVHWGFFDAQLPARIEIASGDTITVETVSGWGGVVDVGLMTDAHRRVITEHKRGMGPHILTGPVAVKGAQPGHTLEVRIKAIELTADWGWMLRHPLKGALPEDFPDNDARCFPIDRARMTATLPWGPVIPLQPFFGIMATAPRPEYGVVSTVEPREFGGNIDCKEFCAGTSLFLPVETCLRGTFELVLHTDMNLAMPRAITPTHFITFGLDTDLDDAAKQALRDMIAWLVEMKGWSRADAYLFCSLACDLRVTQLVDGNKGIHAMVRRDVLADGAKG
jgi:acetamidase/formamidase